jgi:ATP-dependent Clp endopeptidase proteolytic subunit ClpP
MRFIYKGEDIPETVDDGENRGYRPSILEAVDNRIYFYAEIERDKILQLNKSIRELSGQLMADCKKYNCPQIPIYLHVNSYGGSVFNGLSAMDEIQTSNVPIITIVDGAVASAATFLTVVGAKRQMKKNSFVLIHQLSSVFWGKYGELQDAMKNCDRLMETIRNVYKTYTKVPANKLDQILKHDIWWDAKTCLKYGIVDEII